MSTTCVESHASHRSESILGKNDSTLGCLRLVLAYRCCLDMEEAWEYVSMSEISMNRICIYICMHMDMRVCVCVINKSKCGSAFVNVLAHAMPWYKWLWYNDCNCKAIKPNRVMERWLPDPSVATKHYVITIDRLHIHSQDIFKQSLNKRRDIKVAYIPW